MRGIPNEITDNEQVLLADVRDVNTLTRTEATEQLQVYRRFKMWGAARYYALDTRVQSLATAEWVREDVFGHTFTGK